jgi:hypothetical protein
VDEAQRLSVRIAPPSGFERAAVRPGSFAAWLRGLPLKPGRPPVRLYDGRQKANQAAHHAVVDIDVGTRDLQQCADAVMRLRAEYLYASGNGDVRFDLTSGQPASLAAWFAGDRPTVRRNAVAWTRTARPDRSYASFRRFLDAVYGYAGSASLARQLEPVADRRALRAGDVFIRGGFPGHAVLVVDVARAADGRRVFLIAQSYMPAQEIHVLRNPGDPAQGPWYDLDFGPELRTPEWTFAAGELKRFSGAE